VIMAIEGGHSSRASFEERSLLGNWRIVSNMRWYPTSNEIRGPL
jgi:hypothetical protein